MLLFVLFVVLVVAGILGYIFRSQISQSLKPEMMYTVTKYDPDKPNAPISAAWDHTQKHVRHINSISHSPSNFMTPVLLLRLRCQAPNECNGTLDTLIPLNRVNGIFFLGGGTLVSEI